MPSIGATIGGLAVAFEGMKWFRSKKYSTRFVQDLHAIAVIALTICGYIVGDIMQQLVVQTIKEL